MIIIYVTFPNLKEAKRISKILIKEKLAACINIFQSHSIFIWKNKINNVSEYVALIKTKKEFYKKS